MKEVTGDIWSVDSQAVCIPTNGIWNTKGHAVMGKGLAKQAVEKIPGIDETLGYFLRTYGNHVHDLAHIAPPGINILSFPTKYHWKDKSYISLIERSAGELSIIASERGWERVTLPRVGCGNGGLDWIDVSKILRSILDDRFIIVNPEI